MSSYPLIPAPWEIPIDFTLTLTKSIFPFFFPFSPRHRHRHRHRHLSVFNSDGSLAYRLIHAPPKSSASTPTFTLFHASSGATLLTLINQQDQWKAFRGAGAGAGAAPSANANDNLLFTANILSASSRLRAVVDVFFPHSNVASFRLTGNPFARYCTITKDDTLVAQTYLLYKLKKRIYSRTNFRLTVYPRNDHVLVLAMLTTFFANT